MKHVVIVIFQAVKYPTRIVEFEESLKRFKPVDSNFELYYLKIMTENQIKKYEDSINKVTFMPTDSENNIELLENSLCFINGASLKECLNKYIKNIKENKYYFISAGHSRGLGFYNMSDDGERGFDILWNFELAEAIKHLQFELAVFNNCNVGLFDNLSLFSKNIKFLIATENYTAFNLFDIDLLLRTLSKRLDSGSELQEIGQALYDNSLFSILSKLKEFKPESLKDLSLFYYDLSIFKKLKLDKQLNGTSLSLIKYFNTKKSKLKKIRTQLPQVGSAIATIDLIVFFKTILNRIENKKIKKNLLNFNECFNKTLLSPYQRENKKELNGTSIYFPKIGKGIETDSFYKYYIINETKIPIKNWHKFLKSIQ